MAAEPEQGELTMLLQLHRAVETMEIWSASSGEYLFVISFENPVGPGFHGPTGYVASWRAAYIGRSAIRITGTPFKAFDETEAACDRVRPFTPLPDLPWPAPASRSSSARYSSISLC